MATDDTQSTGDGQGPPGEHHPAILQILQHLPPTEAQVLRLYMDVLMRSLNHFFRRTRTLRTERNALLKTIEAVLDLHVAVVQHYTEQGYPAAPGPADPAALNDAQRQALAAIEAARQHASQPPRAPGGAS